MTNKSNNNSSSLILKCVIIFLLCVGFVAGLIDRPTDYKYRNYSEDYAPGANANAAKFAANIAENQLTISAVILFMLGIIAFQLVILNKNIREKS